MSIAITRFLDWWCSFENDRWMRKKLSAALLSFAGALAVFSCRLDGDRASC